MDTHFYQKRATFENHDAKQEKLGLEGIFNLLLLAGVVGGVLLSGFWKPNIYLNVYYVHVELQNIVRDALLLSLTYISWTMTPKSIR